MAFVSVTLGSGYFVTLHHSSTSCRSEDKSDDVTDRLEDLLNCLVHDFNVLNGEY